MTYLQQNFCPFDVIIIFKILIAAICEMSKGPRSSKKKVMAPDKVGQVGSSERLSQLTGIEKPSARLSQIAASMKHKQMDSIAAGSVYHHFMGCIAFTGNTKNIIL